MVTDQAVPIESKPPVTVGSILQVCGLKVGKPYTRTREKSADRTPARPTTESLRAIIRAIRIATVGHIGIQAIEQAFEAIYLLVTETES